MNRKSMKAEVLAFIGAVLAAVFCVPCLLFALGMILLDENEGAWAERKVVRFAAWITGKIEGMR